MYAEEESQQSNEPLREIGDLIVFRGHPNVSALHPNSIEVTTDNEISMRADCIIGVSASKACAQLNSMLKTHIKSDGNLKFILQVQGDKFEFYGRGSSELTLTDRFELVLRRSQYVSPRTAALHCSCAASDIPRQMIEKLKDRNCIGELRVIPFKRSVEEPELDAWHLPDWYPV